jgi:hypothetical protein
MFDKFHLTFNFESKVSHDVFKYRSFKTISKRFPMWVSGDFSPKCNYVILHLHIKKNQPNLIPPFDQNHEALATMWNHFFNGTQREYTSYLSQACDYHPYPRVDFPRWWHISFFGVVYNLLDAYIGLALNKLEVLVFEPQQAHVTNSSFRYWYTKVFIHTWNSFTQWVKYYYPLVGWTFKLILIAHQLWLL